MSLAKETGIRDQNDPKYTTSGFDQLSGAGNSPETVAIQQR